jgi:hypothetical protein
MSLTLFFHLRKPVRFETTNEIIGPASLSPYLAALFVIPQLHPQNLGRHQISLFLRVPGGYGCKGQDALADGRDHLLVDCDGRRQDTLQYDCLSCW